MARSNPSPLVGGRRYATKQEAADYMGVSVRTVSLMVEDGRLRKYRFGKQTVRIDLNEVDALGAQSA
jgi:excisionase family DNA binding protein